MDQWTNQDQTDLDIIELKFSLILLLNLLMLDFLNEEKDDETDKELMVNLFCRYRNVSRLYRRAMQAGYPLSSFISMLSDAMQSVYTAYTYNKSKEAAAEYRASIFSFLMFKKAT